MPDMSESPLSGIPAVEAKDPLAIMCVKLFHSLSLFQSRAKGILLLKLQDAETGKTSDGEIARQNEGSKIISSGEGHVERRLSSQKSLTSLAHSPNVPQSSGSGSLEEGIENSAGQMFQKTVAQQDKSNSPTMPSAPKASRGAPPSPPQPFSSTWPVWSPRTRQQARSYRNAACMRVPMLMPCP